MSNTQQTAAVIGTGFIGGVHIGALRRLGVNVVGVLGSSPERGAARAAELGVAKAYRDLDELLCDTSVENVHVASPNHAHYPQVKALLAAGKNVMCEKPLALTSDQSAKMVKLAKQSGKIAGVCYNIRFYPLNQHARGMVVSGALGDIRFITGHYHQDWLSNDTDWNWRLETDEGGALRSVSDIGTHWFDLVSFITGMKADAVFADLTTFIKKRHKPLGSVETFSSKKSDNVEMRDIETDDVAMIMLRYSNGGKAVFTTSQINIGRKNSLCWDIVGSSGSAAWDSEKPDHLWVGHRSEANEILQRDASLMNSTGAAAAYVPGGHVEGFGDTFHALFAQFYRDVADGLRSTDSTYASFEEGHDEICFCDAVMHSDATQTWVKIANRANAS